MSRGAWPAWQPAAHPDVPMISTRGTADSSGPLSPICVINYQEPVKSKSQAKDTGGSPGFRLPSSRVWAQCPAEGCRGHRPSTARGRLACPCLPHACGPGSAFMSGAPLLHQPSLQMAFVSLSSPGNNQSRRQRPAPRCKSCSWVLWGSPREGHRRCNARPTAWELPKREKELEAALLAGAAQ